MSIIDTVMSQFGGSMGSQVEGTVITMLAAKMGLDPAMAQTAIAALTQAHPQPGDTVATAAQQTGISPDILGQVMGHLGGEGALGTLAGALGGGAAQPGAGTGGIGGALSGMLGGLMGGKS